MEIGTAIKEAREAAGLTQLELAQKAQVHRTYVNQLENGHRNPTIEVFMRICEAMNLLPSKVMQKIERKR
jgi:transcriptional regulator with XRE-family HTH domain